MNQGGKKDISDTQVMINYLLLSAIFVYCILSFCTIVNMGAYYLFVCFVCRVIILTAGCFNHPRSRMNQPDRSS